MFIFIARIWISNISMCKASFDMRHWLKASLGASMTIVKGQLKNRLSNRILWCLSNKDQKISFLDVNLAMLDDRLLDLKEILTHQMLSYSPFWWLKESLTRACSSTIGSTTIRTETVRAIAGKWSHVTEKYGLLSIYLRLEANYTSPTCMAYGKKTSCTDVSYKFVEHRWLRIMVCC